MDRKRLFRFVKNYPLAAASVGLIALFALAAIFAPWLAPWNPMEIRLPVRLAPPSTEHWLGCDELGRDILSRILMGARVSLSVGSAVVAVSLSLGVLVGLVAGYWGGRFDAFINVIVINSLLALPGILLAIAVVAFLGPGFWNLVIALSLGGWIGFARLARAQTLQVKELEFIEAARALGASHSRILFRHLLPNILPPVLVQASIAMAGAVLAEASLSFLGLGVPPPTPSWGSMLNSARGYLFSAPHLAVWPALALMLAILSFNFLGDALRDLFDPRSQSLTGNR
ncbi:MAG: ABC transporter permease [Acidobacteria bacterium]|nr:ABC transporter permease [Acidobacteriota bacterium]